VNGVSGREEISLTESTEIAEVNHSTSWPWEKIKALGWKQYEFGIWNAELKDFGWRFEVGGKKEIGGIHKITGYLTVRTPPL